MKTGVWPCIVNAISFWKFVETTPEDVWEYHRKFLDQKYGDPK